MGEMMMFKQDKTVLIIDNEGNEHVEKWDNCDSCDRPTPMFRMRNVGGNDDNSQILECLDCYGDEQ